MAYMTTLKATRGGFVAHLMEKQTKIPTGRLKDAQSTLSIFGIAVCQTAKTYGEFCERMKDMERVFVESLNLD